MRARAFVQIIGSKGKLTPHGTPHQFSTPMFDTDTTTPEAALAELARKWHGIMNAPASHFELLAEYDVMDPFPAHRQRPDFDKVYLYEYLPERELRAHKGIPLVNYFDQHSSWYLQRKERN